MRLRGARMQLCPILADGEDARADPRASVAMAEHWRRAVNAIKDLEDETRNFRELLALEINFPEKQGG